RPARLKCGRAAALVRPDTSFPGPAKNDERAAEEQQLRAERSLPPTADNHIALSQRAVEMLLQPRLDRHVASGVECDQVDQIAAAPITGSVGAEDQLRRNLAHTFELGEARA